jgi:hypothetical protein
MRLISVQLVHFLRKNEKKKAGYFSEEKTLHDPHQHSLVDIPGSIPNQKYRLDI